MRTDHVVLAESPSLSRGGAAMLHRERKVSTSSVSLRRRRLLWVDDSAPLLSLYKSVFGSLGFEVLTTSSPEEALRYHHAHSTAPDVVILDYDMPAMNGAALAALIKDHYPLTPVILYSGNICLPDSAYECVDAICTKGAPREELLATIERLSPGRLSSGRGSSSVTRHKPYSGSIFTPSSTHGAPNHCAANAATD
jgi:CheY-like chemotaxis protein